MVNYYLYRVGQFIALNLPLRIGYLIAVAVSDLRYLFAKVDRRIVTENLTAIFPVKTEKEIAKIRIKLFRNFAKYLVDFFRFEKIDVDYIHKYIKIQNLNYLKEALSKGKGAIILSAHLGNWELGGIVVALSGYPLWAVALPHKDKKVDLFFNFQRERKGIKVIPFNNAVRMCLEVLKNKGLLALIGDRDFSARGITVDFFGKSASFPEGPAVFFLRTGSPIVPIFMVRNHDDTFTLRLEKPLEIQNSDNKHTDLREIILKYKIIFEGYIREYPDQWYMFRRFWSP